jgi:hypothetical protein
MMTVTAGNSLQLAVGPSFPNCTGWPAAFQGLCWILACEIPLRSLQRPLWNHSWQQTSFLLKPVMGRFGLGRQMSLALGF